MRRKIKPVTEHREEIRTGNYRSFSPVTITYRWSLYMASTLQVFNHNLKPGEIRTEHVPQKTDRDYYFELQSVLNTDDYISLASRFGCFNAALDALKSKIHHKIDTGAYLPKAKPIGCPTSRIDGKAWSRPNHIQNRCTI